MPKGRAGAKPGEVRNPHGKNQYVERKGEGRNELLRVRVSQQMKSKLLEIAQQQDLTLTDLVLKAISSEYNIAP